MTFNPKASMSIYFDLQDEQQAMLRRIQNDQNLDEAIRRATGTILTQDLSLDGKIGAGVQTAALTRAIKTLTASQQEIKTALGCDIGSLLSSLNALNQRNKDALQREFPGDSALEM